MLKIKIILIVILTSWISLSSQTPEDYKTSSTSETFPLHNIQQLDVRAKHAQVKLLNWDKDSISVQTSITIFSNKANLAKEMLQEIRIKTVGYGQTLQVKTILAKNFNRTIPYEIRYTIFYPKKVGLRVENMHGSVHIEDVQGGVFADISYCDINIGDLSQESSDNVNHINLLHCKGKISQIGTANIEINNSTIEIENALNINATTAYSLLNINRTIDYQGSSQVDNIKIGTCDFISIASNNSILHINHFSQKGLFECTKGLLTVSNSGTSFQELTINNHETPTTILLNDNTSYILNGEIYNGVFKHIHEDQLKIVKDQNKILFNGIVGNNQNTNTKVIIFNKNQKVAFN